MVTQVELLHEAAIKGMPITAHSELPLPQLLRHRVICCNLPGRMQRGGEPKESIPQRCVLAPIPSLQCQLVSGSEIPFLDHYELRHAELLPRVFELRLCDVVARMLAMGAHLAEGSGVGREVVHQLLMLGLVYSDPIAYEHWCQGRERVHTHCAIPTVCSHQ